MIKAHHNFVADPKVNGTEILEEPPQEVPNLDATIMVIYKEPQEVIEKAIAEGRLDEMIFQVKKKLK